MILARNDTQNQIKYIAQWNNKWEKITSALSLLKILSFMHEQLYLQMITVLYSLTSTT
jgi:hypothetical protein